jgi:uncharacterized protein (DUF2225 family)
MTSKGSIKPKEVKVISEMENKQIRCPNCHEQFQLTEEILNGQAQ